MGNFLSVPILAIAVAFQATLMTQIRLLGGAPDLVFLIVLSWAINARLEDAVLWAFIGGIMQDLMSSAPTGASVLGMLLVVFAIGGLGGQVYRIGFVTLLGVVIIGTAIQHITMMGVLAINGYRLDLITDLAYVTAPTIFYNLIFIGPIYWVIRRLQQQMRRPDSSVSFR
jgi:rod shape-determining protein MreD